MKWPEISGAIFYELDFDQLERGPAIGKLGCGLRRNREGLGALRAQAQGIPENIKATENVDEKIGFLN